MLQVDENLDDLTKILGAEPLDKTLANFLGQELVQRLKKAVVSIQTSCCSCRSDGTMPYRLERFINNAWVVEMIIGVEVELVQEVPDIDTA